MQAARTARRLGSESLMIRDPVHELLVVAETGESPHGGGADLGVGVLRQLEDEVFAHACR